MDTTQIAKNLTEDEAHALIWAIREEHGFTGTIFVREDAAGAVANMLEAYTPAVVEAFQEYFTDSIMETYYWRKMGDRLSELGNEILDTAADEAIPFPASLDRISDSYAIVLGVDDEEGIRTSVIEIGPFATPDLAVAKALTLVGQTGTGILAAEPTAEPLANLLLDRPVQGYSLAVIADGATRDEFPARLPQD